MPPPAWSYLLDHLLNCSWQSNDAFESRDCVPHILATLLKLVLPMPPPSVKVLFLMPAIMFHANCLPETLYWRSDGIINGSLLCLELLMLELDNCSMVINALGCNRIQEGTFCVFFPRHERLFRICLTHASAFRTYGLSDGLSGEFYHVKKAVICIRDQVI